MILNAIAVSPVKGLRGIAVQEAVVELWGLQGDRRWTVVDAAGRYLTQRDLPGMARVAAVPDAHGLTLFVDGMDPLHVPLPDTPAEVLVWRDRVQAQEAGPDAAAWLSRALGHPCRLVHMGDPAAVRGVDPAYAKPEDRVSFADAFPVLVVNTASLDDLNARLVRQPVPAPAYSAWATVHQGCLVRLRPARASRLGQQRPHIPSTVEDAVDRHAPGAHMEGNCHPPLEADHAQPWPDIVAPGAALGESRKP